MRGALPDCFPVQPTWYVAHLVNGDQVLSFRGRVVWRQGNRTGLAFVDRAPGHDLLVQGALRQLLRDAAAPDLGNALDSQPTWPARG